MNKISNCLIHVKCLVSAPNSKFPFFFEKVHHKIYDFKLVTNLNITKSGIYNKPGAENK